MKRGLKVASWVLLAGALLLLAQVPRENFGLTVLLFSLAFGGMLGSYLLAGEDVNFKKLLLMGILLRGCLFFFEPFDTLNRDSDAAALSQCNYRSDCLT